MRIRRWSPILLTAVLAGLLPAMPASAAVPGPVYGVTIDDTSQVSAVVTAEQTLPRRPTTRVVFDTSASVASYKAPVAALDPVSYVMGELLDSSEETSISTAAFGTRVNSFLSQLGASVNVWEIGNEVNGNWTGPYATVSAKLAEAYDAVAAAGAASALTLYANNFGPGNCGDGTSELTPVQFTQQYVPARVAAGLSYVWLSYYPTQCGGVEPSAATVAAYLVQLHALYPAAQLGFGELGLPNPATSRTLASAKQIMAWGYGLNPGLGYYVGGYFWWYGAEDAFTGKKLLGPALGAALSSEAAALGG
jgi:hypothetical protein